MHILVQLPKPRSDAARALADARYKNRIVRDKKKYSRKGKSASKPRLQAGQEFGDSIKPATIGDWLIEFTHKRACAQQ